MFRSVQLLVFEDAHAYPMTGRWFITMLDDQAMVRTLFEAPQVQRVSVLIADQQTDDFCIKLPALDEVARREYDVASSSETERGIEIDLWHVHELTPESFCRRTQHHRCRS